MSVRLSRAARTGRRLPLFVTVSAALSVSTVAHATIPAGLDFRTLTAERIIQDYTNRVYTPTELTQAYLDRIATYNPVYNAYTTMNPDVLADAAALTAQLANPSFVPPTPIWGVPTGIKDPMNVRNMRTTVGSSYFGTSTIGTGGVVSPGAVEMIPATDSPIVARLRNAGALILGKTSVCDFSRVGAHSNSSLNGITRNAYDIGRTPGGSSGGSGTAVSLGLATIATAEETGSSITNPASVNGIVGIRPTFGTIPSTGVFPLAGYFRDTNGTFGKTVKDAVAMYDMVAGPNIDARPAPALNNIPPGGFSQFVQNNPNALSGKRIAALNLDGLGFSTTNVTNTNTRALFDQVKSVLTAEGATVIDDPFGGSAVLAGTTSIGNGTNAASPATWRNLIANVPASGTQSWDVRQYLLTLGPSAAFTSPEEYNAEIAAASGRTFFEIPQMPAETLVNGVITTADPATRADLDPYRARAAQLRAMFNQIMTTFDLDALVLPQLAAPAGAFPPGNPNGVTITRTPGAAVNIIGNPGIVVPGGFFADGQPFATYFLGDLNDDANILAMAADYEAATNYRLANLPILTTFVPEPGSLLALGGVALVLTRRQRRAA
jgi:amidase